MRRLFIAATLVASAIAVIWSCAGSLDNIEEYRNGAGVLASCFGEDPPKFLTSSRCTQCHLSKGDGIGAALDLKSDNIGERLTGLIGSCPEAAIIDPAHPEESTLYLYVDDQIDECTYHKMPPTGSSVSAADKNCLLTWIDGLDAVDDLNSEGDDGADGGDGDGDGDGDDDGDSDSDSDDMQTETDTPTLAELETNVFGPSCGTSSCHSSENASPPRDLVLGPSLSSATLHDNIVNKTSSWTSQMVLIKPSDPAASFLLLKLKGTQGTGLGCDTDTCGSQMPYGKSPLSSSDIADIEAWVSAGAPQ